MGKAPILPVTTYRKTLGVGGDCRFLPSDLAFMAPERPAPHQVYSEELSNAFRRGHPIAVPHPGVKNGHILRPVSIGDVGYIHPIGGNFVRLFNVHLEPGVDGQPQLDDLPDDFECLPMSDIQDFPNETPIWVSQSVTRKGISAEISGPFFGGFVEFESSKESGAILATPDPIDWSDALNIMSYKVHAKAHIEGWLQFARGRGHDIKLEQLTIVTGVDRTTSWATAVFSENKLEAGFGLEVQFSAVGAPVGLQLACQYSWRSTSSALVNSGPSRSRPNPMPAIAGSSLSVTPNSSAMDAVISTSERQPINTVKDQSLFIRHIRAKRRRIWRGMKIEAAGSDEESESDKSTDEEGAGAAIGEITITGLPKGRKFIDCLEPALDYILEHSNSDIAIAHDEDLARLPAIGYPLSGSIIDVQDSVGMLSSSIQ
ncbi:hypothetical protein PENSPDRAFT_194242 [Peniophora sp. CONT]|nr:hypothetical protein PENSPDRAFT_194242 [Peniophora sp. CONT]